MESREVMTKTKWEMDPAHSEIGFKVVHLRFSNVRGRFKEFKAHINTNGNDFKTAEINVQINAASIDTGIAQRDEHLRSADFFDVENFKEISFAANTFVATDKEGKFAMFGDLTMRGIKKEIKLDVEFGAIIKDPWGAEKALFTVDGKINRKDWGLNYNSILEAGGFLLSEDVWIHCEVQLINQGPVNGL